MVCPSLKELISYARNVETKKYWGQNFLVDVVALNTLTMNLPMMDQATCIEIGPGPGLLTRLLVDKNPNVYHGIEIDERWIQHLKTWPLEMDGFPMWFLHHQDVLHMPFWNLGSEPRFLVGNLPYHISGPLIATVLPHIRSFQDIRWMVQKEFALRLTASVGSEFYGRLSVLTQWLADIKILAHFPPQVFKPEPKVHSVFLSLHPRIMVHTPLTPSWDILNQVTKICFQHRRKILKNALIQLEKVYGISLPSEAKSCWNTKRAQELHVADYIQLALYLQ
jgi:16S rRNA (adenine1518-N6/adenine1519-N6)-dimethyltransferase